MCVHKEESDNVKEGDCAYYNYFSVVTLSTTLFNIKTLACVLLTECIYEFRMILRINSNQRTSVMEKECVFCVL